MNTMLTSPFSFRERMPVPTLLPLPLAEGWGEGLPPGFQM